MVSVVFLLAAAVTWLQVSAAPAAAHVQKRELACQGLSDVFKLVNCMDVNATPACGADWTNECGRGWFRACYAYLDLIQRYYIRRI